LKIGERLFARLLQERVKNFEKNKNLKNIQFHSKNEF